MRMFVRRFYGDDPCMHGLEGLALADGDRLLREHRVGQGPSSPCDSLSFDWVAAQAWSGYPASPVDDGSSVKLLVRTPSSSVLCLCCHGRRQSRPSNKTQVSAFEKSCLGLHTQSSLRYLKRQSYSSVPRPLVFGFVGGPVQVRKVIDARNPLPGGTECSQSYLADPDRVYFDPCRGQAR